jgi:hypothetical protein
MPNAGEAYNMAFRLCDEHNCTDEDCKDYKDIVELATKK